MKYRRKPEYVEAIQWTGTNYNEIKEFAGDQVGNFNGCIFIHSSGIGGRIESMVVNETDYIVKGSNGTFRSMDKQAFTTLYEPETQKKGEGK